MARSTRPGLAGGSTSAGDVGRTPSLAAWAVWGLLGVSATVGGQEAERLRPEPARLREVVETLASPEFGGRSGAGGRRRRRISSTDSDSSGSKPCSAANTPSPSPARSRARGSAATSGRCSAAPTRSSATSGSSSAAHFDHLGVRGGKLYPGADDNASGVAMMLEVGPLPHRGTVASETQHHVHRLRPRGGRPLRLSLLRRASRRSRSTASPCSSRPT